MDATPKPTICPEHHLEAPEEVLVVGQPALLGFGIYSSGESP
jgi:hypothetical protein